MRSIAFHRTDVFLAFIMAWITMLLTKCNVVMRTDDTSQIETAASPRAIMFPTYTQCLLRANEYIHNIMSYSRRVRQKRNRHCRTSVEKNDGQGQNSLLIHFVVPTSFSPSSPPLLPRILFPVVECALWLMLPIQMFLPLSPSLVLSLYESEQ